MTELLQLKKSLSAARGWASRSSNALKALLDRPSLTRLELEDAIEDFDKRLHSVDDAQSAVELELDEENLEAEIDGADEFRRKIRAPRILAAQKLVDIVKEQAEANPTEQGSTGKSLSNVRLPSLELPKFSGELTEWQSFWDRFVALVDDSDIPVISKFSYLLSLLDGEAKSVIKGLALTTANYAVACTMLKERFGRSERIIFAHIQALLGVSVGLSIKPQGPKYVSSLWKLQDDLLTHIRSLKALGVSGDQFGVVLTPVILSRLPHDIRMEWSREGSGHESDLEWLLKFLQQEIERRERSETFKEVSAVKAEGRAAVAVDSEKKSTALALQSVSDVGLGLSGVVQCSFCNKKHKSEKCFAILKLSIPEREEKIKSGKLCFRCLNKGHISRGCMAKCTKCNGGHNILCCKGNLSNQNNAKCTSDFSSEFNNNGIGPMGSESKGSYVNHVGVAHSGPRHRPRPNENKVNQTFSVLQTATITVYSETGASHKATLLFDTGSDKSYVSSNFVKKVKPKWLSSEPISYTAFGGSKSANGISNVYDLKLLDRSNIVHSLSAVEIPTICTPLIRPCVPNELLNAFSGIELADNYKDKCHLTVDILVGLDAYWKFMNPGNFYKVEGLIAQESVFGWVLSGAWSVYSNNKIVSPQLLSIGNVSDATLHNFWNLESIGISSNEAISNCMTADPVLKQFSDTVTCNDGRYTVSLPWKSNASKQNLLNNEKLARKRFESLNYKLDKDPNLKEQYNAVFKVYEEEGIVEEVPPSEIVCPYPTYYLPHRPVVRENSTSTKVRPVFDASAVGYNGLSLNDCLNSGPSLIPNLVEILMRFRRWKVALTADITKAFLQIVVQREDRDVHRFLWKCYDTVRVMRFTRVPFGNKSSPFLLNATIKHHLESFPSSEIVEELKDNLYVDDWLSGADSDEEGCVKFNKARAILSKASMSLTKWNSNSKTLRDQFNQSCNNYDESEAMKILGMQWLSSVDCFAFDGLNFGLHDKFVSTKRAVLSAIARLFDPLGLISPFTMLAKILFQDIWRLGLGWDEVLPSEMQSQFQSWVKGTESLKSWKIPRCYFENVSWKSISGLEIHGFGDASEKGYGACVYLRIPLQDGSFKVSLVVAKGKVAPIKRVTIPRLELLGALLCCRLVVFVKAALRLGDHVLYRCWTDSQVALCWIRGDPSRWKMFVSNRVVEIQSLTPPSHWYHCPGMDNPADIISRGMFAERLMSSSLWLYGPPWLSGPDFPQEKSLESPSEENYDNDEVVVCVAVMPPPNLFDIKRWNNFSKALNIVAWVLRFINNSQPGCIPFYGPLTYDEITKAKSKLFYSVQQDVYSREVAALKAGKVIHKGSSLNKLDPIVDAEGLLRIKGRLEYADLTYDSKHPVIIPTGHLAKLLVRFQHRFLKHAGVSTIESTLRSGYWIVGLRRIAKTVCRECVFCRRQDSRACTQPVAPLPESRVKAAPPFTVTGVDYAGPLFCVDVPSKKFYILLFTCAVVRSVHLELTDSLSLPDCILAFRRFAARRGVPSIVYSDNAKTFVGADNLLRQYFGPLAPQWKFIVPRSPWWGGWWERLVRSVKSALRKSLGVKCLSRCELETTLHEVEACVNSRPLTFVGDEPDIFNPLTPSHFLIGRTAGFQPRISEEQNVSVSPLDLQTREAVRKQRLDKFWDLWSNNYLRNLPPTVKGFVANCALKKGSIVLIQEDKVPRLSWPLGVVVDLFPGKDGIVRSVNVKTAKGIICRSVQRLHDLEISNPLPENLVETLSNPEFDKNSNCEPVNVIENIAEISPPDDTPYVPYSRRGRLVKPPVKLDL